MAKAEIPTITAFREEVDSLFKLEKKIEVLKGEASGIEATLKEKGTSFLRNELEKEYGSLNLAGTEISGQIQVRHASVSLFGDALVEAKKKLGKKFDVFFSVESEVLEEESVKREKIPELKKLILKAGEDPSAYISPLTIVKVGKAKDSWFDGKMRKAVLGAAKEKLFEAVNAVAKIKGDVKGIIAFKWVPKKES